MNLALAPAPTPTPSASPTARITWLDTFRGLSIALVVLGHVLGGLAFASFVPESGRQWLWAAYDLLYTFRMPAMFLASGLFAARSLRKGLPRFLGDKFRTLAYPYLIWSLIGWVGLSAASGLANNQADPLAPLRMLVDPMQGVWFLYVLFVVMVGYGFWAAKGWDSWGFLAAGAVLHLVVPLWESAPSMLVQVSRYAVYFGLGLVLAEHVRAIGGCLTPGRLLLLVPTSFGLMKLAVACGMDERSSLDLLPAMLGTTGMFGVAMLLDRLPRIEALRSIGRNSLPIYVAGGHGSVATRIFLNKALGLSSLPPHIVLGTVAGLVLPLALVVACKAVGFRYLFAWPKPEADGLEQAASTTPRRHSGRVVGVPAP
jgi:fucose 4-O-acetylase-like acetyltransferase